MDGEFHEIIKTWRRPLQWLICISWFLTWSNWLLKWNGFTSQAVVKLQDPDIPKVRSPLRACKGILPHLRKWKVRIEVISSTESLGQTVLCSQLFSAPRWGSRKAWTFSLYRESPAVAQNHATCYSLTSAKMMPLSHTLPSLDTHELRSRCGGCYH